MNESEIKAEMRLWAIEVLVANAFAMLCGLDPNPDDVFAKIRRQTIETLFLHHARLRQRGATFAAVGAIAVHRTRHHRYIGFNCIAAVVRSV